MGDKEARGISLSDSLSASVDHSFEERTIYVNATLGKLPEVTLTGSWDGRLLQGAIKAIEKQYRLRKLTARRNDLAHKISGGE